MRSLLPLLVFSIIVALAPAAFADRIRVPRDHATIQEAVDAALPGDEIVLRGRYFENVLVENKSDLVIRAAGRADIDASAGDGRTGEGFVLSGCRNVVLRGLRMLDSSGDGFVVADSQNVFVERCQVFATDGSVGISIVNSEDVTITRCKIRNAESQGIRLSGPGHVVTHCRVVDSESEGIDVISNASDCRVERNRVSGSTDAGIRVKGLRTQLLRNRVLGGLAEGIRLERSGHDVEGNRVRRSAGTGIELAGKEIELRDNHVDRTGGHGVDVTGIDNLLDGNRSRQVGGSGFRLEGDGNTMRGNRGRRSAQLDLFDVNAVGANTYEDNDFATQIIGL